MIVIDEDGNNLGEKSREESLELAKQKGLDLVLVSPNNDTPVARIVDWAKFKYERAKKIKKNKQKSNESKEWWFNSTIEEFHIKFKLEDIKKFLNKTNGVAKITVKYVSKTPPELVTAKMQSIMQLTGELFKPVSEITREGKNLSILVKKK